MSSASSSMVTAMPSCSPTMMTSSPICGVRNLRLAAVRMFTSNMHWSMQMEPTWRNGTPPTMKSMRPDSPRHRPSA